MIDIEVLNKSVNFRQIVLYSMEPGQTLFRFDIIKAVSEYAVSKGVTSIVRVDENTSDYEVFQQNIFGINLFIFDISKEKVLDKYEKFVKAYQKNVADNPEYVLPNRIMICYDKDFKISDLLKKSATVIDGVKPNKSSAESILEYYFRKNPHLLRCINISTVKEMLTNWIVSTTPDIYRVSEIIDRTCYEFSDDNSVNTVELQRLISESMVKDGFRDFHPLLFAFLETPNKSNKMAILDYMNNIKTEITPKTYYLTLYNALIDFYIVNKELGCVYPENWSQYKINALTGYQVRTLSLLKFTQLLNKYECYLSETDTPLLTLNWMLDKYLKSESSN